MTLVPGFPWPSSLFEELRRIFRPRPRCRARRRFRRRRSPEIAKQERIRISERVHAGLAKARKQGRIGGRLRLVLNHAKVLSLSQEGATIREIAEEMGVSPASIHRILKGHHRVTGDAIPV